MMTAAHVLDVLDVLDDAAIRVWVDGGWGVDALLGEQTREHNDLDIAINHDDVARYRSAMERHGYRDKPSGHATPRNFVMIDDSGREVDVHLVDREVIVTEAEGVAVYGPNGLAYEVGSLEGTGTIAGRAVACCTAEFQMRSHTGYQPDADDVRDITALHERFGIPLPPSYR
jgi:lincosamide nucleotidyltransferase A/C/D/E